MEERKKNYWEEDAPRGNDLTTSKPNLRLMAQALINLYYYTEEVKRKGSA